MIRAVILLLALLLPTEAMAQCAGAQDNNTVCGNVSGSTNVFSATPSTSFPVTIVIDSTVISGGTPNGLLYDHAGKVGNLATGNNGVLVTNGTGVPSISSTLPSGLTIPAPFMTVPVTAETADHSAAAAETNTCYTNTGASGAVNISLPAAVAGLKFCAIVDVAQNFAFVANGTDKIAISPTITAAGGNIVSNQIYSRADCLADATGRWNCVGTGPWTVN